MPLDLVPFASGEGLGLVLGALAVGQVARDGPAPWVITSR